MTARHRILIVDDAPSVRESLSWLLEEVPSLTVAGTASNGMDTIHEAIRLQPDLVILDIELPDVNGFVITQMLKKLPVPPLVVLLSVHGDEASRQYGAEAGCDAFVEKGTLWEQLLNALEQTLAER